MLSLSAMGIPCSGPRSLPARCSASSARACASAASRSDGDEGVDLRIVDVDARQARVDQLGRRDRAGLDARRGVGQRQRRERVRGARRRDVDAVDRPVCADSAPAPRVAAAAAPIIVAVNARRESCVMAVTILQPTHRVSKKAGYLFCTRTIFTQPLAVAACTLMKPSLSPPITTSSSPLRERRDRFAGVRGVRHQTDVRDLRRQHVAFVEDRSRLLRAAGRRFLLERADVPLQARIVADDLDDVVVVVHEGGGDDLALVGVAVSAAGRAANRRRTTRRRA